MSAIKLSKTIRGIKYNQWNLAPEPSRNKKTGQVTIKLMIKRWVVYPDGKGKTDRYPLENYAHIQSDRAEMERALSPAMAAEFAKIFTALGFKFVTLDLEGFRSGSMNRLLTAEELLRGRT